MNDVGTSPKFRHRVEYFAARSAEFLFRILPYPVCIRLAKGLAWLAFHVVRWRRKEAARRMRQVFPEMPAAEIRRNVWRSTETLFLNIAEIMHLHGLTDAWMERHVANYKQTVEKIRASISEGGAILVLPHFGNWDLAGIVVARCGIPIFSVAGVQHNPLTNDWINRKRATGIAILSRGSTALRQIVKRLKSHEVLAILPDVRMKTPDIEIPFLGATANLGRGMATFARKTGSPILVANVRRTSASRHFLDVGEPIEPDMALDEDSDILRMTKAAMAQIESQIRSDPGQWFWFNKRWVLEPLSPADTSNATHTP